MKIRTANEQPIIKKMGGYRAFVDALARDRWNASVNWSQVAGTVPAEIARGNWRVMCPYCSGAIVVEPGCDFWCPDCAMVGNQGAAMIVEWPVARDAIEYLLLKRPDPANWNWMPGESVDDLRRENILHGIEG